jgi:hypothetical protein
MKTKLHILTGLVVTLLVSQLAVAQEHRSSAAKAAFEVANPCPSTGAHSGPCPGYIVDHIKALACGGADDPSNMQWQTVADAAAKDKWERKGCSASTKAAATETSAPESGKSGKYECGGKSKCGQMRSCEEARFYLNSCGLRKLDRDNDGIPCESLC